MRGTEKEGLLRCVSDDEGSHDVSRGPLSPLFDSTGAFDSSDEGDAWGSNPSGNYYSPSLADEEAYAESTGWFVDLASGLRQVKDGWNPPPPEEVEGVAVKSDKTAVLEVFVSKMLDQRSVQMNLAKVTDSARNTLAGHAAVVRKYQRRVTTDPLDHMADVAPSKVGGHVSVDSVLAAIAASFIFGMPDGRDNVMVSCGPAGSKSKQFLFYDLDSSLAGFQREKRMTPPGELTATYEGSYEQHCDADSLVSRAIYDSTAGYNNSLDRLLSYLKRRRPAELGQEEWNRFMEFPDVPFWEFEKMRFLHRPVNQLKLLTIWHELIAEFTDGDWQGRLDEVAREVKGQVNKVFSADTDTAGELCGLVDALVLEFKNKLSSEKSFIDRCRAPDAALKMRLTVMSCLSVETSPHSIHCLNKMFEQLPCCKFSPIAGSDGCDGHRSAVSPPSVTGIFKLS